ncbi:MAG: hypothetical protein RMK57_01065 [Bryobacterales bacterium]|nr:hypothetical protein [Bryobacteraceae bacterium]MDW8353094.1 hypothetical protein [Bryobacterales bacterium]
MRLSEAFLDLGPASLERLVRTIAIGKLRTYQLYEPLKVRAGLHKLNSETLRRSAPRFWARLEEHDEDFARDLAQAILLSHWDLVQEVLDYLGVPNEDGFFAKDLDATPYLTPGWQQRVYEHFRQRYPEEVLRLYINHLALELDKSAGLFKPPAA